MSKRRYRPQTPKPRNEELYRAMIEVRRSSATTPQRNKAKYRRAKAGSREREW